MTAARREVYVGAPRTVRGWTATPVLLLEVRAGGTERRPGELGGAALWIEVQPLTLHVRGESGIVNLLLKLG